MDVEYLVNTLKKEISFSVPLLIKQKKDFRLNLKNTNRTLSASTKLIRIIFLFTFALITTEGVNSQEISPNKGKMNIGFETGIQFTGISDTYMPISDNGIGYATGAFFEYFFTDVIKLRAGAYFDKRAFSLSDMGLVSDTGYIGRSSYYEVTEEYNVNYLTIPLSLIYIKGSEKFKFFIQGTLYYSMFLNSNQSGDLHLFISEEDAPHYTMMPILNIPGDHYIEVPKDKFSSSDIGINLLIGLTYNIKPNWGIIISPGFSYSFANVWEDPLRQTTWTRLYKINAGIFYTLKK